MATQLCSYIAEYNHIAIQQHHIRSAHAASSFEEATSSVEEATCGEEEGCAEARGEGAIWLYLQCMPQWSHEW